MTDHTPKTVTLPLDRWHLILAAATGTGARMLVTGEGDPTALLEAADSIVEQIDPEWHRDHPIPDRS